MDDAFGKRIAGLREAVLGADNRDCFIERETILADNEQATLALPPDERYTAELSLLADRLSTPIDPRDEFAGRMAMGRWDRGAPFSRVDGGLFSDGHITIPLSAIFSRGLGALAADAASAADAIGTVEARYYARHAALAVEACRRFAMRYAAAAEAAGRRRMAEELRCVPYRPAFDFHSALQSAWMMQFIMSCLCGARDFAPGRLDQALLPYYRADLAAGRVTRGQAVEWLALFFVKFNEICGTATDNYETQPTPCFSSKQYVTLGGTDSEGRDAFNELSAMIVEAAELAGLPQPTLNFRIGADWAASDWELAGRAAVSLGPQCNFFNDPLPVGTMAAAGIGLESARDYSFTACNRVDLPGRLYNRMCRIDIFTNAAGWFREAVMKAAGSGGRAGAAEVVAEMGAIARDRLAAECRAREPLASASPVFHLESLFIDDGNRRCLDIARGGGDMRWCHFMFAGIATIADGLAAIAQVVDNRGRMTLRDFAAILEADYEGHEDFREELVRAMPKYGNGDPRADVWARRAAEALLDAARDAGRETGFMVMPSFYSLEHHNAFGAALGATPDGRKAGEPVSENQSPTHGADTGGPLALLRSASSLPFGRCICGGLNMRLSARPAPEIAAALVKGYFAIGGQHIGLTFATRADLEAARRDPALHRTLMVRKTGFSEFFVALSPQEQQEMIDRTEYAC